MSVRVERTAPRVAELVMDRPEVKNALSTEQARRLGEAARALAEDPGISVVVLVSALPDAFCVGADLKERNRLDDDGLRAQRAVFVEAFAAIREIGLPTVAAVEGFALGGGYELALSCDLIVAAEGATLGLPEVGLGLVPGGGGTQLLSRRAGRNRALELVLTGRRVGAEDAYALGLVDRLVSLGAARGAARQLAGDIARHSPVSLRAAKRAVRDGLEADLATGLALEDQAWHEAAFSPDRREGVAAFNAKRAPQWPSWGGGFDD
jgi:enoyl-CoA hydratase/carnithine racemase